MKKKHAPMRSTNSDSRKTLRKQKRKEKKLNRQEHYLKQKNKKETMTQNTPGRYAKRPADVDELDSKVKKKKPKLEGCAQSIIERQRKKEFKDTKRLQSEMGNQRKTMLLKANEEEDKMIKKLEKQLGLNKSKNKNNYFAEDGLDYLLEICDRSTSEQIVAAEKHLANAEDESDFEDDLAAVTGKDIRKDKDKKSKTIDQSDDENSDLNDEDVSDNDLEEEADSEEDLENESIEDESEFSDDEPEEKNVKTIQASTKMRENKIQSDSKSKINNKKDKVISEEDLGKIFSDDEVSHLSGDDEDLDAHAVDEIGDKTKEKPDVWEDIYGRKRDKEGNIIKEEKGVYIPPHLRNKDATSDKDLIQLKRQIKSVINKLTGSSLHWASSSLEGLYSGHSRHSVNTCLLEAVTGAVMTRQAAPDRIAAEAAALIAVLHANVGGEVGAFFIEHLSKRFDEIMQTPQSLEDKTLDNLIGFMSHLYNFKIYQAQLLFDMLSRLDPSCEQHAASLVGALRTAAPALRRDEPARLRGLLASVGGGHPAGSRIKFLLDVLLAVKNNNFTKIPNYDPSYTEELRKHLRGVIRKGNYITPLNIGLDDLLKADERGKWWVVGSAWEGGRPLDDNKQTDAQPTYSSELLELARKHRMNTDVRRAIFCVIMSAEDYMDAYEKLQQLRLRGQQQREIVHVLLASCLAEAGSNPYYAVLAGKLCDADRKYQLSIQFSVWDKIKEIEHLPKHSVSNLAQFLTHVIIEKALPLSVLKVIQFSDLNKHTVKFMRQILLAIIMNADLQAMLDVFHRISKPPKLHMFRESLRLFIQHFLVKNAGKKTSVLSEDEMATLKERAMEVDKILTMHETKLRL